MRQIFLLEGKFFAESAFTWTHRTSRPACSGLYYCSTCGKVYMTVLLMDNAGKLMEWMAWAGTCDSCKTKMPFPYSLPGSIWRGWDEDFTRSLPEEVLRRELEIHLNQLENGND